MRLGLQMIKAINTVKELYPEADLAMRIGRTMTIKDMHEDPTILGSECGDFPSFSFNFTGGEILVRQNGINLFSRVSSVPLIAPIDKNEIGFGAFQRSSTISSSHHQPTD